MNVSTRNLTLILATAFAFGFFVWPGRWEFAVIGNYPMRTSRLTGSSEVFAEGRWQSLTEPSSSGSSPDETVRMLSATEKELVTGSGGVSTTGYFKGSMYNGGDCIVSRIVYQVATIKGADTTVRRFSNPSTISPMNTTDVIFQTDASDDQRRFLAWTIDSVEAKCPEKKR